jgi:hypothetical protein
MAYGRIMAAVCGYLDGLPALLLSRLAMPCRDLHWTIYSNSILITCVQESKHLLAKSGLCLPTSFWNKVRGRMLTNWAKIVVLLLGGITILVVQKRRRHCRLFFCPFQKWFWTGVDERQRTVN